MPVPIMPIPDKKEETSSGIDFSILLSQPDSSRKKVTASNKDAKLLFEIWAKGEGQNQGVIKLDSSSGIDSRDIARLKTRGFITGGADEITFTSRGKTIISTMALGEVNRFETKREEKSYTEILASMSKRGKKGYRTPRYAANTSNNLNLKDI